MTTMAEIALLIRMNTASIQRATAQAATATARMQQRQRGGRGAPQPAPGVVRSRIDTTRGPFIRHACSFRITAIS